MRFSWDEAKRRANLRDHEIDFVDAEQVFSGLTVTFEDERFSYDERRFVTLRQRRALSAIVLYLTSGNRPRALFEHV
jgi:uncharacterized protein